MQSKNMGSSVQKLLRISGQSSRALNKAEGLSKHGALNTYPGHTPMKSAPPATIYFADGISHQGAKHHSNWQAQTSVTEFSSSHASCACFLMSSKGLSMDLLGRTCRLCAVAFPEKEHFLCGER